MGSGSSSSSSSSGGSSGASRSTAGRRETPVIFKVNEEKHTGPESELSQLIVVKSVSFLIAENSKDHHTDEYEITQHETTPKLVVRRGQFFKLQVDLDRAFDKDKDSLSLEFDIGSRPKQSNRTLIKVNLDGKEEKNKWNAKIEKVEDTKLIVSVLSSPACIVGRYGVHIRVSNKNSREKGGTYAFKLYTEPHQIYILFNAWCPEDTVYHTDEGLKEEYVLNDSGKIYYGSKYKIRPRPWNFGQFDDVILDCVLDLLDINLAITSMSNSVLVVRKLTAVVNNIGDTGILCGNWSGKYQGGKSPTAWTGSVAILEQYYKSKTPVKYGQCWVFSGVLTTCCRTLGIPARSVTNFASAHDSDSSITIDKHFDKNNKALKHLDDDSVWNYHVWNDAWMARPDIPGDFGGWQACDATPQETSDGVYCCGPFPVKALKEGEVNLPFDGGFIFAEMNADRVNWIQNEEKEFVVNKVTPSSIGFYMSTHRPKSKGSANQRGPCSDRRWEDVTCEYKHKEGSDAEKKAINTANKFSSVPGEIYGRTNDDTQDISIELRQNLEMVYGETYDVEVVVENKCSDSREVQLELLLQSMTAAGVVGSMVRDEEDTMVIAGKETKTYKMSIPFEEYEKKTLQFCNFEMNCGCKVKETGQTFLEDNAFCMDKAELDVKAPESCTQGDTVTIEVSFKNPLPIPLTKCELSVEGGKIQKPRTIPVAQAVAASAMFKSTFDVIPTRPGKRTVSIVSNFKELESICGCVEISVNAK